ncbi:hypothetical protein B5F32_05080 [Parabacteroides distasonis]|uniref:DUF4248 domain-containing protein n=1 Tax=Parabacteroides distasonis TaxID=823 RepID=A0A1Y4ILR3_PARDI|nr:hypothetical protein B5F32_05080 [Parabacteroides distasonis]
MSQQRQHTSYTTSHQVSYRRNTHTAFSIEVLARYLSVLHANQTCAKANQESAIADLRNLMKHNPDLLAELKEACYKPHNKTFTPKQTGIIVHYLGEP